MTDKAKAAGMVVSDKWYIFRWKRPAFPERKGTRCKVLVRGKMNSCKVEFEDGFRAIISRNALQRAAQQDGMVEVKRKEFC